MLFSPETLKPLKDIFDREEEKRIIKRLLLSGSIFVVSGFRRVGKDDFSQIYLS